MDSAGWLTFSFLRVLDSRAAGEPASYIVCSGHMDQSQSIDQSSLSRSACQSAISTQSDTWSVIKSVSGPSQLTGHRNSGMLGHHQRLSAWKSSERKLQAMVLALQGGMAEVS